MIFECFNKQTPGLKINETHKNLGQFNTTHVIKVENEKKAILNLYSIRHTLSSRDYIVLNAMCAWNHISIKTAQSSSYIMHVDLYNFLK